MNKFSMGNAFNEGKALVMQRPLLYIGLLLLAQIIGYVVMFLPLGGMAGMAALTSGDPAAVSEAMTGGLGSLFIVSFLAGLAIMMSGSMMVWRHGLGNVSVGEAIIYGLKAAIPLLILTLAMIVGLAIVAVPVGLLLGTTISQSPAIGVLLAIIGILALLYLFSRIYTYGCEMAANNSLNPFSAVGRSWLSTQGNGWMIALFLIAVYVVYFIVYMLASMIIAPIVGSMSATTAFIVTILLMIPVLAIGALMGVGLPAGIYRDLVGQPDRAEIFS